MLSGKHRFLQLITIAVLFSAALLIAGTTGKIAGRVLDGDTREPLVGVNIVVKGTTLGATTDIEGYYTILTVSPGTHSIVASMVGYSSVTVNDIRVQIDQTATVNVELPEEAVRLGDIMVVAERSNLRKDVSTSVVAVQPEEIASLPVTSVAEVIGLQAGVEEGLAIRGGTDDQNLLQIDGISQRDPRDNSPITVMSLTSIQEVSVEKGGFNAEYGQVQSGIINIVAKEGNTGNFSGAVQIKYTPPAPKHFGISIYDPNSMWNRPFLDPAVSFTGTESGAWDLYTQRQYPIFDGWNAVSQRLLTDNDPTNDLSPAAAQRVWQWERRRRPSTDEPDYNIDASFGGPVPFISSSLGNLRFFTSYVLNREMFLMPLTRDDYKEYNWSLKVNSDISKDMKLMLSGSIGKFYSSANNFEENFLNNPTNFGTGDNGLAYDPTFYFRSPISIAQMLADQRDAKIYSNGWYSAAEVGHSTIAGKLTTFITPTTYYDVSVEHVNREYGVGPIAARDVTKRYEVVPGYFVDEAPYGFSTSTSNSPVSGMFLGGHTGELVDSTVVNSYKAKFDLTSQITNEHLMKFGVEFNTYDLNLDYKETAIAYGSLNAVKEQWNPYQVSAYAQDKIEAYGFIANIGVRLDVSNPNTEWVAVDDFDKYYAKYDPTVNYPKEKAEVDVAFSPRIGISHPITENSKLYFNYGHFKQLPSYTEMFRIGRGSTNSISNAGDPNLVQAKTVAYELGYDHVLFESYLLQIQGFYKDISNLQGTTTYNSDLKAIRYLKATNNNYGDIRGVELTFKKTEGNWMRGFLTYNYQVNTTGAFGNRIVDENPAQQRLNDQSTQTLYQTKPVAQPHARLSFTFLSPKETGSGIGGVDLLGNWSLNILGDWRAGAYINYNPNQVQEFQNIPNVQGTDNINVNLRINKVIDIAGLDLMVFMEIRNLFNHKLLSGASFYDAFDQQFYFESLHLPESAAYDNIPGEDRIGEYNSAGYFQPIEWVNNISALNPAQANAGAYYYDKSSKKYYEHSTGSWQEVGQSRIDEVLDKKAYIDMPNNTSFNFLNPRQIFFGVNLSF